jgi:drug/metabolite transporter (DMT)-like permease
MLLIVLMYALFAGTFSLGKVLACYSQPIFLVGIRMFLAGSFLMVYEFMQHGSNWRFDRKHTWYYVQIILFTTYIPYSLRFWALRSEMTASKACLLYNLSPFMTYIFSYFLYSEKVTIKKIIGLIIGFIGFLPTVLPAIKSEHGQAAFLSLPEIAILCSVACLSYGWIMIHRLVKFHNYEATTINSMSMFCGGLLALITSWLFESNLCDAIILDAPFARLDEQVHRMLTHRYKLPHFPFSIVGRKFLERLRNFNLTEVDSIASARQLKIPVLMIHSENDETVPIENAHRIYQEITAPKELWVVSGSGHARIFTDKPHEYEQRINEFLNSL